MCRPKIHQTYRYGYIKDVILPRTLDDATFATISSLMLFNNVEVRWEPALSLPFPDGYLGRQLKLRTCCGSFRIGLESQVQLELCPVLHSASGQDAPFADVRAKKACQKLLYSWTGAH